MRTTKVLAFSVPPEMEVEIIKTAKKQHRTLSEFIREALRQYMEHSEIAQIKSKLRKKAKSSGLRPSDIEDLVDSHRK